MFVKRKISLPLIPLCEQFLETYRLLILTPTKMAYGDDKLEREAADFKDDCSYLSNYNWSLRATPSRDFALSLRAIITLLRFIKFVRNKLNFTYSWSICGLVLRKNLLALRKHSHLSFCTMFSRGFLYLERKVYFPSFLKKYCFQNVFS